MWLHYLSPFVLESATITKLNHIPTLCICLECAIPTCLEEILLQYYLLLPSGVNPPYPFFHGSHRVPGKSYCRTHPFSLWDDRYPAVQMTHHRTPLFLGRLVQVWKFLHSQLPSCVRGRECMCVGIHLWVTINKLWYNFATVKEKANLLPIVFKVHFTAQNCPCTFSKNTLI